MIICGKVICIGQLSLMSNIRIYHWKSFEMNKKGWKTAEKMLQSAFGCAQHPKAGQNTQHTSPSAFQTQEELLEDDGWQKTKKQKTDLRNLKSIYCTQN